MKTALITGASSGIGLELAKVFAKEGYQLILVSRSKDTVKELPSETIYISRDLSEPGAAQSVYNEVSGKGITIDVLVNNAGFGDYGYFIDADVEKLSAMIHLNIGALTELTYYIARDMKQKQRGRIMNLASTAAFLPGPKMAVYYATKHYVLAFSEALAEELAPYNISVTALCPGPTASNFQKASHMDQSKLLEGRQLPSAQSVAEFGYNALMKGKRVAVHGVQNKFLVSALRLLPRQFIVKAINRIQ